MRTFSHYIDTIERIAATGLTAQNAELFDFVKTALDGGPSDELAKSDSLDTRRATGSFFTGSALAQRAVAQWRSASADNFTYLDPACGAGDLLLAVAHGLPVRDSLFGTLALWEECFAGFDTDPRFVAATKARLVLLARTRCQDGWNTQLADDSVYFPKIVVADGLKEQPPPSDKRSRIIMNPPFTMIEAPLRCCWGGGRVSTAAMFVDHWIECLPHGAELVAILPDVLRSGSRYQRWRESVESRAAILSHDLLMRFSKTIDVDVFLLSLRIGIEQLGPANWWLQSPAPVTIGDLFEVRVGAVVPHRHVEEGSVRPFATTHNLLIGRTVREITTSRKFMGTVFKSPFLTVRRTSRPGERRCGATLVVAPGLIAVENHLLVLIPRDHHTELLQVTMAQLNSHLTDEWLDIRIRCRHLTVAAVRSIPLNIRRE